jgi:hypothetical protein
MDAVVRAVVGVIDARYVVDLDELMDRSTA